MGPRDDVHIARTPLHDAKQVEACSADHDDGDSFSFGAKKLTYRTQHPLELLGSQCLHEDDLP